MTHSFKIELPTTPDTSPQVLCNSESNFDLAQHKAMAPVLSLMLTQCRPFMDGELAFVKAWDSAHSTFSGHIEKAPLQATKLGDKVVSKQMKTALTALRALLPTSSDRASAYKILFGAAIYSSRSVSFLVETIVLAREILEIDVFLSSMIADAIGCLSPEIPYYPDRLTSPEKDSVLGLCCAMLFADNRKHASETSVFRLIMSSFSVIEFDIDAVSQLSQIDVKKLLAGMSQEGISAALVNVLRIMVSDRTLHSNEQKIISRLLLHSKLPPKAIGAAFKFVMLEQGKAFRLENLNGTIQFI
jgi:uncharacterized tellurite resistance protein B-like protein